MADLPEAPGPQPRGPELPDDGPPDDGPPDDGPPELSESVPASTPPAEAAARAGSGARSWPDWRRWPSFWRRWPGAWRRWPGAWRRWPGAWRRCIRRRSVQVALLSVALLALTWSTSRIWPRTRAFAVEVRDQLGMTLVEGHADAIHAASRESQVDPPLLAAIMFMESRGRGGQTSSAGAHGLMQLVPAAAADSARRLRLPEPTVDEMLQDDELNIRLGADHLAWLLRHRGDWDLEMVLVSYNAGRAKLFRWIEAAGSYRAWRARENELELAGEPTTGSLRYARSILAKRLEFVERGVIRPLDGITAE